MDRSLAFRTRRWIDLALGRLAPSGPGERRHARVVQGAVSALGARAVGVLATLAIVPLTIRYLGPERYGAWITISTTVGWLQVADLGIGNGLTNALAEALASGPAERAREVVATAFWLLVGVAALLGVALAASWPWLDWSAIFAVHSPAARTEIPAAVAAAATLYLAGYPLALVDRIYAAMLEGPVANAWAATGSVASLAATLAVTRIQGGLPLLVVALSGAQLTVSVASAAWLFWRHRPALRPHPSAVRRASLSRLGRDGWRFFTIQVIGIVLFGTDNLIISHVLGPEQVTPYSVAFRLFGFCTMIVGLYLPYLWPAYVDAVARRDAEWLVRTFTLSVKGSALMAAALAVPLAAAGAAVIRAWAGPTAVPPAGVLAWMAAWAIVNAAASAAACMLNAAGQLTGQMIYGVAAAAVNVALSIVLARRFGITGVIAATVIAYLGLAAVPSALECVIVVRRLRVRG